MRERERESERERERERARARARARARDRCHCGTFFLSFKVFLCFVDLRVRKIRNKAFSCPRIFSSTLRFYYVASSPGRL